MTQMQAVALEAMPTILKIGVVIVIVAVLFSQLAPMFAKGGWPEAEHPDSFKRLIQFGFGGIGTLLAGWFFYTLAR